MIPEFDENMVMEWFRFKKKASEFDWPKERWVSLIANMLKDKALEVYDRMSVEDLKDYVKFKAAILRPYELQLDAYSCSFPEGRKDPVTLI